MNVKKSRCNNIQLTTEKNISVSNTIIRGAHSLSLAEKRVIFSCIAKIDSIKLEENRYKFKLTAKEFAETFDVDINTAYDQLKSSGDNLMKRIARTIENTSGGKKEKKWVWVSGVIYHHGEGWVEIGFSNEMTPHLFSLRNEFTSYKLKQASALRSTYSWRLFELMMQFKKTGILRITIEEFCHAMDAPLSCRTDFFNLKKRLIEPAIKELSEKNKMSITWSPTKKGGRKITGLEFVFSTNSEKKPSADQAAV